MPEKAYDSTNALAKLLPIGYPGNLSPKGEEAIEEWLLSPGYQPLLDDLTPDTIRKWKLVVVMSQEECT